MITYHQVMISLSLASVSIICSVELLLNIVLVAADAKNPIVLGNNSITNYNLKLFEICRFWTLFNRLHS